VGSWLGAMGRASKVDCRQVPYLGFNLHGGLMFDTQLMSERSVLSTSGYGLLLENRSIEVTVEIETILRATF